MPENENNLPKNEFLGLVLRTLVRWNSRLFPGFPGDILTKSQMTFSRQLQFWGEKISLETT